VPIRRSEHNKEKNNIAEVNNTTATTKRTLSKKKRRKNNTIIFLEIGPGGGEDVRQTAKKKHGRPVPEAIGGSETEVKRQTFHLFREREPASAVCA